MKFHDIPNTVAAASRVAARLGVKIFNVHCLGGLEMMRAAADAARETDAGVKVIGVTILTSHDSDGLKQIGLSENAARGGAAFGGVGAGGGFGWRGVFRRARYCRCARVAATIFCSSRRASGPRKARWATRKRVLTPSEALKAGANYLVVGRPITGAADAVAAARGLF